LQWLQDPIETSADSVNNVRSEARRYFRNKERGYLKNKMSMLVMNGKSKNIRQ
jgi:hypothetical protein